jgi:hypothetical protein
MLGQVKTEHEILTEYKSAACQILCSIFSKAIETGIILLIEKVVAVILSK